MSNSSRSSNRNQRNRSHYNLRKSKSEQRREIQERLTGLRSTRTEIDNQCSFLEELLDQLHLTETAEDEDNQSNNHTPRSSTRRERHRSPSESEASSLSFEEVSFRTAATTRSTETNQHSFHHPDSSFSRIRGISAIPSPTVPPHFDPLPPFNDGDAVQITNPRDPEAGKQGVVHKKTNCFVYFSHDRASYQRAPQNVSRIHISQYKPW